VQNTEIQNDQYLCAFYFNANTHRAIK